MRTIFVLGCLFFEILANESDVSKEFDELDEFSAVPNSTLSPEQTCGLCQTALRTVFGHFGSNIPSRRKLVHQLKHECKRHFNPPFQYRRRCLLLMKQHYNMIFLEMTDGSFSPLQACLIMKECGTTDTPITVNYVDLAGQPEAFALVASAEDISDTSD